MMVRRIEIPPIKLTQEQSEDAQFVGAVLQAVGAFVDELEDLGLKFPPDVRQLWKWQETS
jgi:hypothetical protein